MRIEEFPRDWSVTASLCGLFCGEKPFPFAGRGAAAARAAVSLSAQCAVRDEGQDSLGVPVGGKDGAGSA